VEEVTSASQIGVTWEAPTFDGGSAIVDYRIWTDYASNGATFTMIADTLTDLSYVLTNTQQGSEYQLKVEVRN
jgi:hypothetical protein